MESGDLFRVALLLCECECRLSGRQSLGSRVVFGLPCDPAVGGQLDGRVGVRTKSAATGFYCSMHLRNPAPHGVHVVAKCRRACGHGIRVGGRRLGFETTKDFTT